MSELNLFSGFNYAEAVLWSGMALFFGVRGFGKARDQRLLYFILAIGFLAFSISDLVEVRTGAWWRPWWLLLWKGVCVLVLARCLFVWYRISKRR
ncbi:MAG: hypothetical protein L3J39_07030 [Verrucomicrobiales bacterium]|nr:hypothetical protein [Verrucomicrobiales bacterium]